MLKGKLSTLKEKLAVKAEEKKTPKSKVEETKKLTKKDKKK